MKLINKIIEKLKNIFSLPPCPECNGKVKSEYLDMTIDKLVFKCTKCGKEYIGL